MDFIVGGVHSELMNVSRMLHDSFSKLNPIHHCLPHVEVLNNRQLQCVQQIACDKSIVMSPKITASVTWARFNTETCTLLTVLHVRRPPVI